ncbi:hypothetical protein K474DRAFT_1648008 [Panus rudis PR-1116 ss-1]|nr:hypothetical protein K474DRAFT_1648008 [Panus rudis PR-1116 ss-1]
MPSLLSTTLAVVIAVVAFGTTYSIVYNTYLDTSNPLLTHLPHPLYQTHYFASKKNPLNVYFVKKLWGWVTAGFVFLFATSPSTSRRANRIVQYLVTTGVWLIFTSWFFGPAVLDRVTASTGGECILTLPSGGTLNVPHEFCYTKSTISPSTHPSLFSAPFAIPDSDSWSAIPRLRRGHDVSGHLFLLTMGILFLADQLRYSFARVRTPSGEEDSVRWSPLHRYAVCANFGLLGLMLLSIYTTSVYFHTPFEKLTGLILGLFGFALTQLPVFQSTEIHTPVPVVNKRT